MTRPEDKNAQSLAGKPVAPRSGDFISRIASLSRSAIVATALVSEGKHVGMTLPAFLSGYAVDFALPMVIAGVAKRYLPGQFAHPTALSYALGFGICAGSELMQRGGLLKGTYDVNDFYVFAAGTVVGYLLNRASERHSTYRPNFQFF